MLKNKGWPSGKQRAEVSVAKYAEKVRRLPLQNAVPFTNISQPYAVAAELVRLAHEWREVWKH